jgi:rhodanese-related sulfurtransferase
MICDNQMKNKFFISLFILLSSLAFSQSALKVNSIEFKASYFKYRGVLLDVRTPSEYNEGHIENARNLDFSASTFETEIDKLDREQTVFLYCAIGVRSTKAANLLRKKGFKHVFDLDGGYTDLIKVGMKSVK